MLEQRIGCAGWSIGSPHRALFGDGGSALARYATRFGIVEINSSFYRSHSGKTYERWAGAVPGGFRFSVKLPRTVTHDLRLQRVGDLLDDFVGQISGLGGKLGGVLVQLPPSLAFEPRVAHTFFAMLRRRLDAPVACEPRHASWFLPGVDAVWTRHGIARVAADPSPHPGGGEPGGEGGWRYWRLHGSPAMYYSPYREPALVSLASVLGASLADTPPWVIFDNTAGGHAIPDAARLQALLTVQGRGRR